MPAEIRFRAIRPKRFRGINPLTETQARAGIRQYLEEVKRELIADYGRVPSSANYNRTGALRRGWKVTVPSHNFGELTNNAANRRGRRYAVFVQGPFGGGRITGSRQSQLQRKRGWRSISDIVRQTRKHYVEIMNRSVRPRETDF